MVIVYWLTIMIEYIFGLLVGFGIQWLIFGAPSFQAIVVQSLIILVGVLIIQRLGWLPPAKNLTTIKNVAKSDMDFVWVSNHYDVHLSGLCRYGGQLCTFQCENPHEDGPVFYTVEQLSDLNKLKWLTKKKLFEFCIDYYWTYPDRTHYHTRRPKWLTALLFGLYYHGISRKAWRTARNVYYIRTHRKLTNGS